MADGFKNNITKGKKMSLGAVKKKQVFKKASLDVFTDLKIVSLSDSKEELFYSLNQNLFQLEKDMAYFNFAVKEVKDIIKFSYS